MKKKARRAPTLRESLAYHPVELAFGTSGLRGLVSDITNLEAWANVRGFLAWLLGTGAVAPGSEVFVAGDLRPSTASLVSTPALRGEILQAACRAIVDSGLAPVCLGALPTPALVLHALGRHAPAVMVTGSHIPFDRNGIKLTGPTGEVTKADEAPILQAVRAARDRELSRHAEESIFDAMGMLRPEHRQELPPVAPGAGDEYEARYVSSFPPACLAGRRIVVWQHSATSRDLLPSVLRGLGAEVVPAGRTDDFVAVDTEAVDEQMLAAVQALVDTGGPGIEAVVSTDGDGDRPLVFAVENGRARFVRGDLLGALAAGWLGVRHAAVPVNVSDAVDEFCRGRGIEVTKTRIGSPWVIEAMKEAGWEGNGGFLTAAPVTVPGGGAIGPLPTRDAFLPILAVLAAAASAGRGVGGLLNELPRRYAVCAVVRDFPSDIAREIMRWLSPGLEGPRHASPGDPGQPEPEDVTTLKQRIEKAFAPGSGLGDIAWLDWLDGVRIGFDAGDVIHLRPSGNAPEMRVYTVSGSEERARELVRLLTAEGGALGRLRSDAAERIAINGLRSVVRPVPLHGAIQHYDWGGFEYIPRLIGIDNPASRPFAELWMGAHPRGPATVDIDGAGITLDRLITADPWTVLGSDVALRFAGRLPYLFKVLDVRIMASIQAHPSKSQAEEGYARENAAGIPVDAPDRNYRDENHKPEVHVALTDFWMLHGFRPLEEIAEVFSSEPELAACMPDFDDRRAAAADPAARSTLLRGLYERVMTMPQGEVDAILSPLLARLEAEEARGGLRRSSPGLWALRAARAFPLPGGHRDRGIVSVYLLNLVTLKPGQGTYQPAGTLHAYLEGADVELMANSDNVLRGGLTPKHIDVPELLATLDFRDGRPPVLEGRATSEAGREYETPAEEFALERIEVSQGVPWSGGRDHGPDTIIAIEGAAAVVAAGRTLVLTQGAVALVPGGLAYSIASRSAHAVLFKAGLPNRA